MFLALALAHATQTTRPNIVMIFSDDHARSAISAYGSNLIRTRNIDRLAAEGVRFDRHYTTNPLCAPSRAALLTGKYSHANGHRDNNSIFDGAQETFPKLLQAAGYRTAVVGKWHLESNPTGFDNWEILPGQGDYYNPDFITAAGRHRETGYVTEIITQKALDWIDRSDGKPFFLLVGHKAPHRNWQPGPKQWNLFNDTVFPEPSSLRQPTVGNAARDVHMRVDRDLRPREDLMVGFTPARMNPEQKSGWAAAFAPQDARYRDQLKTTGDLLGTNYQRYVRNYLRCVAGVDESVGEILKELDRKGLANNTIVVYASDQGFFVGEQAWFDKRWFYEPSAGTPLLVRWPGHTKPGSRVDSLTSNVDVAPTFLEMAGVRVPSEMQGKSLAPLLEGKKELRPPVYAHYYESEDGEHHVPKYVAVRTDRYKLAYYYELGEWDLFDLKRDPAEAHNLWKRAALSLRTSVIEAMLARMRELKEDPAMIRRVEEAMPRT